MFAFLQGKALIVAGVAVAGLSVALAGLGALYTSALETNARNELRIEELGTELDRERELVAAEREVARDLTQSLATVSTNFSSFRSELNHVKSDPTTGRLDREQLASVLCRRGYATTTACAAQATRVPPE